ncbi:MAG: type II toxin-antitoxin system RelE/ParE family toxin [Acidobacteriaceae bacterium]
MKIAWSPRAVEHLIAIRAFIAEDSPDAAQTIAAKIIASVEQLALYPNRGRAGRVPGTRELPIAGTAYILPYRVKADRLEIVAVFHGRQLWPDSF